MNKKFSIYENPNYRNAFIVVNNETGERVECHNLATARAHIQDQLSSSVVVEPVARQMTLEEYYGCQTGGMGYTPCITWVLTGRTERVHNWGTAKSIARSFPKKQWSV